jgi:uncharacterized membrane protein YqaE (UPF0057 family)
MYFSKLYTKISEGVTMGLMRVLICLFCPPLAVLDKGCGSLLLVLILTGAGWIPGTLAALIICNADKD